ncbi:MFS transporter [Chloroflexota bacterium]
MLAHLAHHLITALPVPLLPFIRDEFALDYTRAGLVISAFGVVYGISQLPAGWFADRIGPHTLVTIGICGVAVAGLLTGLSTTYIMLIVYLVLMGLLGGGYHPASTTMLAAVIEPKRLGRAMGFHMIGGGVSFFLAPLVAAGIATVWGWRGPFLTLSIPTFILGIIFYQAMKRRAPTKKSEPEVATTSVEVQVAPGRLYRLVTIIAMSSSIQATIHSVISLMPLFLVDRFGISKVAAAASIAIVYSAGLWAGLLGGYISDRIGRIPIILVVCFAAGPAVYLLHLAPYGPGINALLVIIGVIIYVNTAVTQAYVANQSPARHRSTVLGFYFFGAMEGSSVITPLIGYLFDKLGFSSSFTIIGAAIFAIALVSSLILWARRN